MTIANSGLAYRVRLHGWPWAGRWLSPAWSERAPALVGCCGAALLLLAAFVSLDGSPTWEHLAAATGHVAVAGIPIAVGIYAWQRHPSTHFGPMFAGVGFACLGVTLADVTSSPFDGAGESLFLIGQCGLIAVILSVPSGRLLGLVDRLLVSAAAVMFLVWWLPTDILDDYTMPVAGAPPFPGMLTMALLLAVTARIGWRTLTASHLTRLTLNPVLTAALAEVTVIGGLLVAQQASGDPAVDGAVGWAFAMGAPAFAMAFLFGSIRMRIFAAGAIQQVALGFGRNTNPTHKQLQIALADALEDPSLRLVHWTDEGRRLVDACGHTVELPEDDGQQHLTEIPGDDRRATAIVHDPALSEQPGLAEAMAALTTLALTNDQLAEAVNASRRELRVSRNRIQSAADTERRRIELDIHDGAQQRIVGLRIRLELAREILAAHGSEDAHLLDGLGDDVIGILDELRSLARGVYPPVLSVRGPEEALRAEARRCPISVTLQSDHLPRYSEDVEAAVYFCCLEAIQNAAKHGTAETRVVVKLSDDPLSFEVRDDGPGFDPGEASAGTGLVHLHDRLAALDGELQVISAPGRGTRVLGRIPAARRYVPDVRSPS